MWLKYYDKKIVTKTVWQKLWLKFGDTFLWLSNSDSASDNSNSDSSNRGGSHSD